MKLLCSLNIILFGLECFALKCPERISHIEVNRCKTVILCMYPGRSTLIDLPCKVKKSVTGGISDIDIKPTTTSNNEIDLVLKKGTSQPTNLTIRCEDDNMPIIFDIIPTLESSTEYLGVTDFTDSGDCRRLSKSHIIDSSSQKEPLDNSNEVSVLIDSSSIKRRKMKDVIKKRVKKYDLRDQVLTEGK